MRKSVALALAIALTPVQAGAHSWYDGSCCSENDCRQTTLGEVERHDNGWYVVALKLTLPFDDPRVRRSLDPLIHICLVPSWVDGKKTGTTLRCLYVPEVAG
jgi:hypothetical protein